MVIPMTPDEMREGIERSLRKCEEHLGSAEILVSNGFLNNAVVCIEFALEEFGRAVGLRDELSADSTHVDESLFRSHEFKYNKAWTVLPHDLKSIYEGTFDPSFFDPRFFNTTGETISPRTRLDATFVNYVRGEWRNGVPANPESLKRLIEGIRQAITTFWTNCSVRAH